MATSLFKMPFDVDRLKVQRIYASKELEHCTAETMSCDKIRKIYGDLKFLELHEDRPCTYTSLVTSLDGRIAFTDAPQGPLIDVYKRQFLRRLTDIGYWKAGSELTAVISH